MNSNKIACVIVTYNRRQLLERCMVGVLSQTVSDFDIFVINNGSTDDTKTYLQNLKSQIDSDKPTLNIVNIEKNDGPALAFNLGVKTVFENGYDWVWIMDDDGVPENHQLEYLIQYSLKYSDIKFFNALVCDIEKHNELVFFNQLGLNYKEICEKDIVYDIANPVNGTFIHKDIYYKVGNFRSSMKIHWIEVEYQCRIESQGFRVATIPKAVHYHPTPRRERDDKVFWKAIVDPFKMKREYCECYIINMGYVAHHYFSFYRIIKQLVFHTAYFIQHLKLANLKDFLRLFYIGWNKKY